MGKVIATPLRFDGMTGRETFVKFVSLEVPAPCRTSYGKWVVYFSALLSSGRTLESKAFYFHKSDATHFFAMHQSAINCTA